jgi:hypothetical protein
VLLPTPPFWLTKLTVGGAWSSLNCHLGSGPPQTYL